MAAKMATKLDGSTAGYSVAWKVEQRDGNKAVSKVDFLAALSVRGSTGKRGLPKVSWLDYWMAAARVAS